MNLGMQMQQSRDWVSVSEKEAIDEGLGACCVVLCDVMSVRVFSVDLI